MKRGQDTFFNEQTGVVSSVAYTAIYSQNKSRKSRTNSPGVERTRMPPPPAQCHRNPRGPKRPRWKHSRQSLVPHLLDMKMGKWVLADSIAGSCGKSVLMPNCDGLWVKDSYRV